MARRWTTKVRKGMDSSIDSDEPGWTPRWTRDEDGWWSWTGSTTIQFQFATGTSPPNLGNQLVESGDGSVDVRIADDDRDFPSLHNDDRYFPSLDNDGSAHVRIAHDDRDFLSLRNVFAVATGLRIQPLKDYFIPTPVSTSTSGCRDYFILTSLLGDMVLQLARALEMVDDPVPLLERLEINGFLMEHSEDTLSKSILRGMQAAKFSKLKVIHWGDSESSKRVQESNVQSLAEVIQANRLPALSGLSVFFGIEGTCSERTVNSLVASVKAIGSLRELGFIGRDMRKGHLALVEIMKSGHLRALESLNLSWTSLSPEQYAEIVNGKYLCAVHTLLLSGNSLGKKGAKGAKGSKALAKVAKVLGDGGFQELRVLGIRENYIGDSDMEALVKGLVDGNCKKLRILDVAGNFLGAKGVGMLADAFRKKSFQSLEKLDVSRNDMTSLGAKLLLGPLSDGSGQSLKNLNISGNEINQIEFPDDDLPIPLFHLDLQDNKLGEEGLKALSVTLVSGRLNALRTLCLRNNSDTKEGAEALVSAFANNRKLVVDVDFEWYKYTDVDRQREQLLERNREDVRMLADLEGRYLPASFSKIYLCGYQEVGKTTLRKSLQRSLWKSRLTWERRTRKESRTRGIQTSRLLCKSNKQEESDMTMVIWDLAGQEEYQLVHNTFFSGLTFAEGSATTFVVICHESEEKQSLVKWLRFIASSCIMPTGVHNRRHVLIVLNCKGGKWTKPEQHWKLVLENERENFQNVLEIYQEPFIIDARRRKSVQELKKYLMHRSRSMLKNQKVPEVCASIQSNLGNWSLEQKQFPVLDWAEFRERVQKMNPWSEKTVEAAAKYLNEAGIIIFISQKLVAEWSIPECKLVILDPNLFCNQVLGDVFLVEGMSNNREAIFRKQVDELGLIPVEKFRIFFRTCVDAQLSYNHLVSIMMSLGLCYKDKLGENLIFPALIREDRTREDCWDNRRPKDGYQEGQWVMGFSVESEQNDVSLAPMALWYRFQVELAQNPEYSSLPNDFVVSRTFTVFTVDMMIVLIQLNQGSDQGSPTFDSINFLVKPDESVSCDNLDVRSIRIQQVELATTLVNLLLKLGDRICPGVKFLQRVIWPWPASNSWSTRFTAERERRNVKVAEVRKWVKEGISMHNWKVGDEEITPDQLLPSQDTEYLLISLQETNQHLKSNVKEAEAEGIFPVGAVLGTENDYKESGPDMSLTYSEGEIAEEGTGKAGSSSTSGKIVKISTMGRIICDRMDRYHVLQMNQADRNHGSLKMRLDSIHNLAVAIRNKLSEERAFQSKILQQIQDVGKIFREDEQRRWPTLMYLGEKKSSAWISLKEAMSMNTKVHVHFCCEAGYDDYKPHPVEGQEGIDIRKMKDWARAAAPWLKVTLTVLFITAKVAANVVAPGLGLVFPSFEEWQQASKLADGVELGTGYTKEKLDILIQEEREESGMKASGSRDYPKELYGKSKRAMTAFFDRMSYGEFCEKLGLQRVELFDRKGKLYGIVWICDECYRKHTKAIGRPRDW